MDGWAKCAVSNFGVFLVKCRAARFSVAKLFTARGWPKHRLGIPFSSVQVGSEESSANMNFSFALEFSVR